MWCSSAVQSWECCAPYLSPTEMRRTTGIDRTPADMACHFDNWLKISSPARPMKSAYMSSATARPPSIAYPTAAPTMAASEMNSLQLRQLVEDLVACAADEVGVHELGDGAASFHRVPDRCPDDGCLRDGRVEQAVIRQGLGEPSVDAERAAPVAVLLAEGDHRGVDGKTVQQGLEDGIADVVQLQLGHRLAVHYGGAHLAGDLLDSPIL